MEAAKIVPLVLQRPTAVWEGLGREVDEDKRGVGWRCYCKVPDRSYAEDGTECGPRRNRIFLVFVNEDRVAYNWRWEPSDSNDPNLPRDLGPNRFRRRLL